jgi:hypothetical protein
MGCPTSLFICSHPKFDNANYVVDGMLNIPGYFDCQIVWTDSDELRTDRFNDATRQAQNGNIASTVTVRQPSFISAA